MSDIQQRIAAVLRDHWQDSGDSPWVRQYECGCGVRVDDRTPETSHSVHVAELLVSELGLRELPTTGYLDPLGYLHMGVPEGETAKDYVQYISGWHES